MKKELPTPWHRQFFKNQQHPLRRLMLLTETSQRTSSAQWVSQSLNSFLMLLNGFGYSRGGGRQCGRTSELRSDTKPFEPGYCGAICPTAIASTPHSPRFKNIVLRDSDGVNTKLSARDSEGRGLTEERQGYGLRASQELSESDV